MKTGIETLEHRDFGPVAVVWRPGPRVVRVFLSRPGLSGTEAASTVFPGAAQGSCREVDRLVRDMRAFLEGEPVTFSLELADMDRLGEFRKSVLLEEHGVPRGKTTTYGGLARRLSTGPRAVGNALAGNPFPVIIPCHRAVRSDGFPGEYQGGRAMKRALLEMEGVRFDGRGRVSGRGNGF